MRTESDFLGEVEVPQDAYYGIFTVRASSTFRLSREKVNLKLIRAVALIKKSAAAANAKLGTLDTGHGTLIMQAADEVISGKFDKEFIIDAFQAGAGTPLHMNTNEVIANRANELLGGEKGRYEPVTPNNHVNMSQSSNDVTPTAIRLATIPEARGLLGESEKLENAFKRLGTENSKLLKCGRTHLMDAVPLSFGQVFGSWARALEKDRKTIEEAIDSLHELGIGGTALGSGINTHPEFKETIVAKINEFSGLDVRIAKDSFETTQSMNDLLKLSAALRAYSTTLNRICNELRMLASGPKTGNSELILPPVEPGSSIMPGKINPSVPEAINMVCWQVMGNDHAILQAAQSGQFELNWSTPLIAHNLLGSLELLTNGAKVLREKCVEGIRVNEERVRELLDSSFAYATALNPYLGYSAVSKLVTEAYEKGIPLKQLILDKGIMEEEDIKKVIAQSAGPSEVIKEIKKNKGLVASHG
jgi:aspartate ammonia-lyase